MEQQQQQQQQQNGQECIVCGQTRQEGITIVNEFICEACEAEMVRTDVQDAKYPFFIHQLRRLWYRKNA